MKPNHQPLDLIRICELKQGDKVMLSTGEYTVTMVDKKTVTLRNRKGWPQYFKAKSQQKVELVKSKSNDKETAKANGLPVSENGKVCH